MGRKIENMDRKKTKAKQREERDRKWNERLERIKKEIKYMKGDIQWLIIN